MKNSLNLFRKGFTLIELLIVIAVLGILAAAVLVAIDPVEQINRGTDSGRLSSVTSLGKAIQANYTAQSAYLVAGAAWQTALRNAGEIKNTITVTATGTTCNVNNDGNVCYNTATVAGNPEAMVWTVLNAKASVTKGQCAGATPIAIAAWISSQGKAGITCVASAVTQPAYTAVLR